MKDKPGRKKAPPSKASTEGAKLPEDEEDKDDRLNAIDRALADSFPASDPPSWTLGKPSKEE